MQRYVAGSPCRARSGLIPSQSPNGSGRNPRSTRFTLPDHCEEMESTWSSGPDRFKNNPASNGRRGILSRGVLCYSVPRTSKGTVSCEWSPLMLVAVMVSL